MEGRSLFWVHAVGWIGGAFFYLGGMGKVLLDLDLDSGKNKERSKERGNGKGSCVCCSLANYNNNNTQQKISFPTHEFLGFRFPSSVEWSGVECSPYRVPGQVPPSNLPALGTLVVWDYANYVMGNNSEFWKIEIS